MSITELPLLVDSTTNIRITVVLLERGVKCGAGEIGARKPDRWLCTFSAKGEIARRELHSDVIGRPPTWEEVSIDFCTYPDRWTSAPLA